MTTRNKKQEIIKSAINIFVDQGFDRPTMDYIAQKTEVSKRTLYKHFSSKRDLLDSILVELLNERKETMLFTIPEDLALDKQVEMVIREKLKHSLDPSNIKLCKIILSEYLKDKGFLKEQIDLVLRTENATLEWIEKLQQTNILSSNYTAIEILQCFNELINGLIFFPVIFNGKDEALEKDINYIVTAFCAIYKI